MAFETSHAHARAGLLVFLPLAEERKGSLRVAAELARALAPDGVRTLLFDYCGTGESSGETRDLSWGGLLEDAETALAHLRLQVGEDLPVAGLGIRTGARILLETAVRSASCPWRGALLLEPVLEPVRWLREAKRRSRFRGLGEGAHGADAEVLDLDGVGLARAFVAELEALGAPPSPPRQWRSRILQIGHRREPHPASREAGEHLGAEVDCLRMPPFWLETGLVESAPLARAVRAALREVLRREPASGRLSP